MGFEYEQSPTWSAGSCGMAAVGPAEAMYVPIDDFGFEVGEVGTCKAFNRRGLLEEILTFYIGNGLAKDMGWTFMGHCVECNTMPGDGRSPYAVSEGRNTAKHYFYASSGCDELTLLYVQEYTLNKPSSSCLASPSLDGTGYIARCGVPSIGTCPKPPLEGFSVLEFPDSSCQLAINRLIAWNVTQIDQCVSSFGSSKPGFLPSTVQSARVCCTSRTATMYYYSDAGCSTTHDPNADKAQLGLEFTLQTCKESGGLSQLSHLRAMCSVVQQDCAPLDSQQEEGTIEYTRRTFVSESATTVDSDSGGSTVVVIGAGAIVAVLGILWVTKSKWMSEAQQAKLNNVLHGTQDAILAERRVESKEMTEKDKILEQYRSVSFQDGGQARTDRLESKSEPMLPGATNLDDGRHYAPKPCLLSFTVACTCTQLQLTARCCV